MLAVQHVPGGVDSGMHSDRGSGIYRCKNRTIFPPIFTLFGGVRSRPQLFNLGHHAHLVLIYFFINLYKNLFALDSEFWIWGSLRSPSSFRAITAADT